MGIKEPLEPWNTATGLAPKNRPGRRLIGWVIFIIAAIVLFMGMRNQAIKSSTSHPAMILIPGAMR